VSVTRKQIDIPGETNAETRLRLVNRRGPVSEEDLQVELKR
jgi:hypothetical protein